MEPLSLRGACRLYLIKDVDSVRTPDDLAGRESIPSAIPSNAEIDLMNAGKIGDVYFGNNILSLRGRELYDLWYEISFSLDEKQSAGNPYLVFHGVDTIAEYFLNGVKIGASDNMLVEHAFDIATTAKIGENRLFVHIFSPVRAASKEEYNAAMVSLCAQVASSYINMRELQQEVKVAQQNCRSQQTVVQITQKRYETGLVSKLDVAQAQSVYYSTKASLPMLEAGIIQYTNSLAILLGLYPSDLQKIMETEASLPEYIEPVGVGLPANLLLRRPDVRAAERQVNALAASLGASKSDWWPKVFVKGSVGFASHDFDKLANHNSLTYEIAPTLTWNFFQGTQKIQATRLAKAQLDESIRQFNQTVLTSVQEVDNAMSSYKNSIKQIVALREVVNQGKQTLDLSLDLYKQGLTPFQNVLDAQRSLLTYQNQLTQAQGSSLLNLIQLYQSLGGGWNPM